MRMIKLCQRLTAVLLIALLFSMAFAGSTSTASSLVRITYRSNNGTLGTVSLKEENVPIGGAAQGSTATPTYGATFVNWTKSEGTEVSRSLHFIPSVITEETYTANFDESIIEIKYRSADPNKGSVSLSSEMVRQVSGTPAGSTAIPNPGYHFVNWTKPDGYVTSTSATNIPLKYPFVGLYESTTYTANFKEDDDVSITYQSADTAKGTVTSLGESLPPVTGAASGSTAVPNPGYRFVNWTNAAHEIVSTSASFTPAKVDGMSKAAAYTANFEEDVDITITYASADTAKGTVTSLGETLPPVTGVASGSTAVPKPGYHFVNWTNATHEIVSTSASFTPAKVGGVNAAQTYTANFEEDEDITITYASADTAKGTVTSLGESLPPVTGVASGSMAVPNPGYRFVNWTNAAHEIVSTSASFTPAKVDGMNKAAAYTAQWAVNQYTMSFDSNGGKAVAPITQDYGTAVTAPAAPKRSGYTFAGWLPEIPATMPATDTTYVAQWKKKPAASNQGAITSAPVLLFSEFIPDLAAEYHQHRFTPLDISQDGEYTIPLTSSGYIVGELKVLVKEGHLTVSYTLLPGVVLESEFFTIFANLAAITTLDPEALEGQAMTFDEPISIADDLAGDTNILLYVLNVVDFDESIAGLERYEAPQEEYDAFLNILAANID